MSVKTYIVWYEPLDQPGRANLVTSGLTEHQAHNIVEELEWLDAVARAWMEEE